MDPRDGAESMMTAAGRAGGPASVGRTPAAKAESSGEAAPPAPSQLLDERVLAAFAFNTPLLV